MEEPVLAVKDIEFLVKRLNIQAQSNLYIASFHHFPARRYALAERISNVTRLVSFLMGKGETPNNIALAAFRFVEEAKASSTRILQTRTSNTARNKRLQDVHKWALDGYQEVEDVFSQTRIPEVALWNSQQNIIAKDS